MAVQIIEGFDHYGIGAAGRTAMLDGPWAQVEVFASPETPSFGARTGAGALRFQVNTNPDINFGLARRVLTTARPIVRAAFAVYMTQLPIKSQTHILTRLVDAGNIELFRAFVLPNGGVSFNTGTSGATQIGVTNGQVLTANAWSHVEILVNRTAQTAELRVNGVVVINLTSLSLPATDYAQWTAALYDCSPSDGDLWFDDLIISDATGTYNTGVLGDLRVSTLYPSDDTATTGWAAYPRRLFSSTIFSPGAGAMSVADAAALNIGTGDFTVEAWVRFRALPTGSNSAFLMGQWREDNNQRSWRLLRWGPGVSGGALQFQISTDGTAGTVTTVRTWTATDFVIGRWFHVAVTRVAGVTRLFINGQLSGLGGADTANYFNSTAPLFFGGQTGTSDTSVATGTVLDGWMDEIRLTIGVGRYTANFVAPTADFVRGVGDPSWSSVQLLCGFGAGLVDESAAARVCTALGSPAAASISPGDGPSKHLTINEATPIDDNYIAADLVRATGILTATGNMVASETVVIGATTYTFVTTLTAANQVLIGVSADVSLQNLQAAVNQETGAGTIYGTGTVANTSASGLFLGGGQFRATAITAGVAGNSVTTTEAGASMSWGAATLTGGADIPGPIIFDLTNLPPTATSVRGAQFYTRMSKSDSGPCNVQVSLRVASSFALGTNRPLTTAPTYWTDIFEEDPSTVAALTVTSINQAAIRLNRTT